MKQRTTIQNGDTQTTQKRGRGRPRKENALTAAERAKRYRDKKRAQGESPKSALSGKERQRLADLESALQVVVDTRLRNKLIPVHILQGLTKLLMK